MPLWSGLLKRRQPNFAIISDRRRLTGVDSRKRELRAPNSEDRERQPNGNVLQQVDLHFLNLNSQLSY